MESTHQNTAIDAELSSLQRDRDVHLEQVKLIDAQIAILRKVRGQDVPKSGSNGHSQGVIFSSLVPGLCARPKRFSNYSKRTPMALQSGK